MKWGYMGYLLSLWSGLLLLGFVGGVVFLVETDEVDDDEDDDDESEDGGPGVTGVILQR